MLVDNRKNVVENYGQRNEFDEVLKIKRFSDRCLKQLKK